MKFSANLGFLWPELSLPAGIHAAAAAGFNAVECHFPYDESFSGIRSQVHIVGEPCQNIMQVHFNSLQVTTYQ